MAVLGIVIYLFVSGINRYNSSADEIDATVESVLTDFKSAQFEKISANVDPSLRSAVPAASWQKLVSTFPILQNYASTRRVKNTHDSIDATVEGKLVDSLGKETDYVMKLHKTDVWRLVSLDVQGSITDLKDETLGKGDRSVKIKSLVVGDNDKNGVVTLSQKFSSETPVIYAGIQSQNQSLDQVAVKVTLVYVEENFEVLSIILGLQKPTVNGFSSDVFATFSRPTDGWPTGKYKIIATLANGQTQSVDFAIGE